MYIVYTILSRLANPRFCGAQKNYLEVITAVNRPARSVTWAINGLVADIKSLLSNIIAWSCKFLVLQILQISYPTILLADLSL